MKLESFESILHPTDFSNASEFAFAHALWISLAARAQLHLLHVEPRAGDPHAEAFPHVRETLAKWQRLDAGAPESAVQDKLGVRVTKATIGGAGPRDGLLAYIAHHACDLMVLASHDRKASQRWLSGSVGEAVARGAREATLFIREGHRGFIAPATGVCSLRHILLPIDAELHSAVALRKVVSFAALFEPRPRLHIMHAGKTAPVLRNEKGEPIDAPIALRDGPVVEAILAEAESIGADLIAMPTAGHHGVLDVLRGSTTERVLHEAPCPLFAAPVA